MFCDDVKVPAVDHVVMAKQNEMPDLIRGVVGRRTSFGIKIKMDTTKFTNKKNRI